MELKICHLYPDVLNLYGDGGNMICMKKRLEWRGIKADITNLKIGENSSLADFDLFFMGGGQDFEQEVLLADLHRGKDKSIISAIEDGKTFLTVCGGYQMLGYYYENQAGVRCEFLGAIDFYTKSKPGRLIGNYSFRCYPISGGSTVLGFENHSGRSFLGPDASPLGKVINGFGNNGEDKTEGVRYKNVFGTYSHGPVLPKNPELCDFILKTALERKYGKSLLSPLDDDAEHRAHAAIARKMMY